MRLTILLEAGAPEPECLGEEDCYFETIAQVKQYVSTRTGSPLTNVRLQLNTPQRMIDVHPSQVVAAPHAHYIATGSLLESPATSTTMNSQELSLSISSTFLAKNESLSPTNPTALSWEKNAVFPDDTRAEQVDVEDANPCEREVDKDRDLEELGAISHPSTPQVRSESPLVRTPSAVPDRTMYTDPFYHRLNQRLLKCSFEKLLVGKQGAPFLKRLQDDPSYDISDDRVGRCLLTRRIADFLLTYADTREKPSPKETRSFVTHLFAGYPNCSIDAFIDSHKGLVECRVRRVRSLLGKRSLLSQPIREYKKKAGSREWLASSDNEEERETDDHLNRINNLIHGSVEHLELLKQKRNCRIRFCQNNPPRATMTRYSFYAQSRYIVDDFIASKCASAGDFPRRLQEKIAPAMSQRALRVISEAKRRSLVEANAFPPGTNDFATFEFLLNMLALFEHTDKKKKPSRVKFVYNRFLAHHSASSALDQLKNEGIRQPVIVAYGDVSAKFIIALEGVDVTVSGDLAHALLSYLACFWLFDLEYPHEVKQELSLLANLLGIPEPMSRDAGLIYRKLEAIMAE